MTPETRRELERLLSLLCEGVLTRADHARLQERLGDAADCRRFYLEYVDMHARLLVHPALHGGDLNPAQGVDSAAPEGGAAGGDDEGERGRAPAAGPWPPRLPLHARGGRRSHLSQAVRYGLVAAATLAASVLGQAVWWHARTPADRGVVRTSPGADEAPLPVYVATLTQSRGCVWNDPGTSWRIGSRLPPGELRLRKGIARVRFDGGSDLVVEGPAHLRLETATSATVLRGKVVFRADETAAPFDLHTPTSTLVDLGTEYAVSVGTEGEEVHVFDGEIERTPTARAGGTEVLLAGEARRYGQSPEAPGQPTALTPEGFVRQLSTPRTPTADPSAGLLAYEGFDYQDPEALPLGVAEGGSGWSGPWKFDFARPSIEGDQNMLTINPKESLAHSGAPAPSPGGSFDYTGFTKSYRRLDTPVRLDKDGVYYLSFLFRRDGPPADEINAVAVLLRTTEEFRKGQEDPRTRLNIGVGGGSNELFTHLQRVGSRTPLPLSYGVTYLLVAKIAARSSNPDQVFMRVYGPDDPVECDEPSSWSVVGPPLMSDLSFDWVELHINSKTRQTLDEFRLGETWTSVTAPWTRATP